MFTSLFRRRIPSSIFLHILRGPRTHNLPVTASSRQLLQPSKISHIRTLYTYGNYYTKRELAALQAQEYEIPKNKKFKDLREEISHLLGGFTRSKTRRAQIINEELVREILGREDWSEWRGCQIVDMNPGFGLFSRVLNELVQPSKHILLEPYQSFNDVLTERMITNSPTPSCTTTLLNLDGYDWASYDKLITEGHLVPIVVPHEEGVNKSILFVANLLMKGLDGERFLTQIIEHIGSNHWIHRYGRIRMLVWVPDSGKARVMPRKFKDRTRMGVITDIAAEVKELAGEEVPDDQGTIWGKELDNAYKNLMMNVEELEKKRAERAANPEKYPQSTSEEELPSEVEWEEGQKRPRKLSPATIKQWSYPKREKEQFLGTNFRAELEAMYAAPGHQPWTPELEHPPWVYDAPDSPIERPPAPLVEGVTGSAAGRKRKDGIKSIKLITTIKIPHQPLTKALRRCPLPNEFVLKHGYDAWQMIEAHKQQQTLDSILESLEDETKNKYALPPPPDEEPSFNVKLTDVKEQYLSDEECQELGYATRPNFQKSGVLLEKLKMKLGDAELAMAWLKALGVSKRKRELVDQLEEMIAAREQLQFYKQKLPPVRTEMADVHPMEPVALLDFTPKVLPEWLAGKDVSSQLRMERWGLLNYILRHVFILRRQSIKDALAMLGPGAEQVAEGIEGLDDGKKRCRVVDADSFVEVAKKWENWPYRDKMAVWEDMIVGMETQSGRDVGGTGKAT
ncbi:hypothetical protein EV426DRAFT_717279 [Tirmania nivea]|nr:hypothetical protein EV426DRAFT_717279 [Tirmania nivea]